MHPAAAIGSDSHPSPVQLQAFVEGEAAPAERLALARHLDACADCRGRRVRIEHLRSQLSRLPLAEEPDDFSLRVMQRVRSTPPPRRSPAFLRLVVPVALLATSALGVISAPLSARLFHGVGRLLRFEFLDPGAIAELVIGTVAAMLGGLGRAVDELIPRMPLLPSMPAVDIWFPMLLVAFMTGLVIMGTMLMVAVAGHGLLRRSIRGSVD